MRKLWAVLVVVGGTIWSVQPLVAQICTGTPVSPGGWALGVEAARGGGVTSYGLGGGAHVVGDLFANASYSRSRYEAIDPGGFELPDANFLSGGFAFQAEASRASVCPVISVRYGWHGFEAFGSDTVTTGQRFDTYDDVDASYLSIPLGIAVGAPLGSVAGAFFLPSISAGILWTQAMFDLGRTPINQFGQQIGQPYQETFKESETLGYAGAGVTIGYRTVFLSGGVSMTTSEGADPVASIGLGLTF